MMSATTETPPPPSAALTSTTAPGHVFASRAELAAHYQTAWHKYNLKRREAGLPVLLQTDFDARFAAAQAVQDETLQRRVKNGTNHLKKQRSSDTSRSRKSSTKHNSSKNDKPCSSNSPAIITEKKDDAPVSNSTCNIDSSSNEITSEQEEMETPTPIEAEQTPETEATSATAIQIDPRQCLFDRHISATVAANVERMHRKYGFFLPDVEYLIGDASLLLGYAHEKIQLGHTCLYCQRMFRSATACQQHMIQTRHTKLRYEDGIDLDEWQVFYDFRTANDEFLLGAAVATTESPSKKDATTHAEPMETEHLSNDNDVDEDMGDGEWEDVSEDEEEGEDDEEEDPDEDDDEELFAGYVAGMGLDVTPLGELVFPDGRIVGHRGFRRYYNQRVIGKNSNEAVRAAQQAARERLFQGRVYTIGHEAGAGTSTKDVSALALARSAGLTPGLAAGRAGRGLLVPTTTGTAGYTQLSLYRYRAAVRKQQRGEQQGQRLHEKTNQNMNRMDKKHNRLMNGVSVAHAAR